MADPLNIDGAMETGVDARAIAKRDMFMIRRYGKQAAIEPTPVMIHIAGFGPRRVYLPRATGLYMIRYKKRFRPLTSEELDTIEKQRVSFTSAEKMLS